MTDEPLTNHTWYKIGGPADFFVYPADVEDLVNLLNRCRALELETYILGDGANVLAADDGYRGVIVNLKQFFTGIVRTDNTIKADAGVLLEKLIVFAEKNSLGGLQCLAGVPGTLGGALIMNAGTHKGEIGDSVREVYFLDANLEFRAALKENIDFNYRFVPQLIGKIVLGCRLELQAEPEVELKAFRIEQIEKRKAKQPLEYPSCGSVFKRPAKHYVGKLVEDAGLRGLRQGDAMISPKHGGFIVNLGNAKASDVIYLIEKIKVDIFGKFGVLLEPEVKYLSP